MDHLDLDTGRRVPPGVYRYAGSLSTTEIIRRAAQAGWLGWRLDGLDIDGKTSFLDASARALNFPGYFGRNWDAYEECMTDLAWAPPAAGYVLVIDSPDRFASVAPADWQTGLSILFETVEYWRRKDKPFYVLLRRTRGAAPEVPLLR